MPIGMGLGLLAKGVGLVKKLKGSGIVSGAVRRMQERRAAKGKQILMPNLANRIDQVSQKMGNFKAPSSAAAAPLGYPPNMTSKQIEQFEQTGQLPSAGATGKTGASSNIMEKLKKNWYFIAPVPVLAIAFLMFRKKGNSTNKRRR